MFDSLYEQFPEYSSWLTKFTFILGSKGIGARQYLSLDMPEALVAPLLRSLYWEDAIYLDEAVTWEALLQSNVPLDSLNDVLQQYNHVGYFNSSLQEMIVPNGVTSWNMSGIWLPYLERVIFPETLHSLNFSLKDSNRLEEVYVPRSLRVLKRFRLPDRSPLAAEIEKEGGLEYYKHLMLAETSRYAQALSIREGTTVLAEGTLRDSQCKSLRIPEGVRDIPIGFCNDCPNLEEVFLPSSLESISYHTFSSCPNLRRLIYKSKGDIVEVDTPSFTGCSPELTFPDNFHFNKD